MKKIPIFGSGVRSYSDIVTRQRRVNCFYDLRQDGDREAQLVVVGTPGQVSAFTLPDAGVVIAMRTVGNLIAIATRANLYIYRDLSSTGNFLSLINTHAFPAANPGSGACVLADEGTQILWQFVYKSGVILNTESGVYDITADSFTVSADTNGPAGIVGTSASVVGISSRFVCGPFGVQSRQFNVSALLDGTTWTPLVFGTKETYGDSLVQMANVRGTLVLLGTSSVEFWQDLGLYPLPFQRIPGVTTRWGCVSAAAVSYVKDGLFFVAKDPDGQIRVVRMDGYTPVPVSTSDIDSIISTFTSPNQCSSLVYEVLGHTMYQVTWTVDNRTLTYDLTSGVWHEAQSGGGTMPQAHSARYCVSMGGNQFTATGLSGGIISKFSPSTYTDNGAAIYRELCTKHLRYEGNTASLSTLQLDFQLGATSGNVSINISRNGGSFGVTKTKSVSSLTQRVIYRRLGSSEDFVVKISTSDPIQFVIANGMAEMELSDD